MKAGGPDSQVVGAGHEIEKVDLQLNAPRPLGGYRQRLPRGPGVSIGEERPQVGKNAQSEVEVRDVSLAFIMEADAERIAAVCHAQLAAIPVEEFHFQEPDGSGTPPLATVAQIERLRVHGPEAVEIGPNHVARLAVLLNA